MKETDTKQKHNQKLFIIDYNNPVALNTTEKCLKSDLKTSCAALSILTDRVPTTFAGFCLMKAAL
jgi:hypothetical protein